MRCALRQFDGLLDEIEDVLTYDGG